MTFVEGATLRELLSSKGRLPVADTLRVADNLLDALELHPGAGAPAGDVLHGRVDHAHPVDGAFGVDVHPQVLQPGIPRSPLQREQRNDAADDDLVGGVSHTR